MIHPESGRSDLWESDKRVSIKEVRFEGRRGMEIGKSGKAFDHAVP